MKRSLGEIVRMLLEAGWRRRYLVCVPVVLMLPLSIVGARMAPNVYEARTIILLQETGKENPFLKDFVVGLHVKERISALRALVKSEHVLLNVLKDIVGPGEVADARRTAIQMRELAGSITVELIGTDLLELRLRGGEPRGMGRTLAAVKQHFLDRLLSPERSTLGATRRFLGDQLAERKMALDEAEREMAEFKTKHADKLPAVYSSNVQRLGTLQQQLQERTMQLASARAAFESLKQNVTSSNPIIGRLEESIVQVTTELASLRGRYTNEHSQVLAAERRLNQLQSERRAYLEVSHAIEAVDIDRLWSLAAASSSNDAKVQPLLVSQVLKLQEAKAQQATLEQDVQSLRQSIGDLQQSVAEFAPIEQQQIQIEKRIASARELYQALIRRRPATRSANSRSRNASR